WGVRWPRARLMELGIRIGMDVPFFLGSGPALATGRGERIEPLRGTGGYALVLVNPGVGLSTREGYGGGPAGGGAGDHGARGGGGRRSRTIWRAWSSRCCPRSAG